MALINEITGDLLIKLAGGRTTTAGSNSTVNGLGRGASFGSGKVDLTQAIEVSLSAFSNSANRLAQAYSGLRAAEITVEGFSDVVNELVKLAELSADPGTTVEQRGKLNSDFKKSILEFNNLLASAQSEEFNYLDVSDLRELLAESGIDTSAATQLMNSFNRLGGTDSVIGYEKVTLSDTTRVDALAQRIDAEEDALIALEAMKLLKKEVDTELSRIKTVTAEVLGAQIFAAEGYSAFSQLSGIQVIVSDPESLAADIVRRIKEKAANPSLAAHSDLDRELAKDLLL